MTGGHFSTAPGRQVRSLTLVQLGAWTHGGGGFPGDQDPGSSASPVPAMLNDGWPLLHGSWEADAITHAGPAWGADTRWRNVPSWPGRGATCLAASHGRS